MTAADRLPLWECDACGHRLRAECVAGDDWHGGELVGVGPDCPVCDAPMDPAPEAAPDDRR